MRVVAADVHVAAIGDSITVRSPGHDDPALGVPGVDVGWRSSVCRGLPTAR
jgi:hypothetical protein